MKDADHNFHTIPRHCSLDGFTELSGAVEGVAMKTLAAFDMIRARTLNSDYRIFVLEPDSGKALVQGGSFFEEPVEAWISGSSFGGCMLKIGWIGVGLRMEICSGGQRIVTSPVQTINIARES